jgi:hypothetical protein
MAMTTNAELENSKLITLSPSLEYSNTIKLRKNKAFAWT